MRTHMLAGALIVALAASPAAADHGKKNLAQTIAAGEARSIAIDFPVGDLRIETGSGDTVRVDLKVECDRWFRSCEDRLEDVELRSDLENGKLHVDIRGYGHGHSGDLEVNGTITVPANRALRVDMGVGQLDIDGISGRLDVDLGVGDVTVRMPASAVRSVSIDAGVGDTTLRLPSGPVDDERSFVSSEIDWNEGRGEASVAVEVGVGDAVVRLE
jgi:hypothetical protein